MTWVNIPLEFLISADFRGSEPTDRATWLSLMAHCHAEENGGRIVGAARWKDRQWQMVCAVFLSEVRSECNLWTWDGDDLIVANYPQANEDAAKARREIGRLNAEKRWAKERAQKGANAGPNAPSNTEGNGREQKRTEPEDEDGPLDDSLQKAISEIVICYADAAQWKANGESDKAALRSIQSGRITLDELRAKVAAIAEVVRTNPANKREYNATPLTFFGNEQWRNAPGSFRTLDRSAKEAVPKIREAWQIKKDIETIEEQARSLCTDSQNFRIVDVFPDPEVPQYSELRKVMKDEAKKTLSALKERINALKQELQFANAR
jgi:hypothetical protein